VNLYRGGEHSTAELADLFGVARSTVYRALQRDQVRGQANAHRAAENRAGIRT
jgi:IS30 family transposase